MNNALHAVLASTCLLVLAGCAFSVDDDSYEEREWVSECRRDPKQFLFYSEVPRDTDLILISDVAARSNPVMYRIESTNIFAELDRILEFTTNGYGIVHGCRGSAVVRFYSKGTERGAWHFAHGSFFLVDWATPASEQRLHDWFAEKGVREFKEWRANPDKAGFPPEPLPPTELDFLSSHQNADGSWGTGDERLFLTSFTLLAYLTSGETENAKTHGAIIRKALDWLNNQSPTHPNETVAMILAYSAKCEMMKDPKACSRTTELFERASNMNLSLPFRTVLEAIRSPTLANPAGLTSESTGHAGLDLYLKTLKEFHARGDAWQAYDANVLQRIRKSMKSDGSMTLDGVTSSVEATTFAKLSLLVYYRFWIPPAIYPTTKPL